MKRVILITLLLASQAFGVCKLPIAGSYTFNGIPSDADSVRYVVYGYNSGTVLYNAATAMDSLFATLVNVDSAGMYRVVLTYYGNGQRLMETVFPVANCYGDNLFTVVDAIRDSGQYYAQVGAGSGGGCPDSVGNAWTIVAWDSINNVAVDNAVITLKSSVGSAIPLAQAPSPFTFTKSSGSAVVVIEATGVTFPVRSFTVSGARTDTINGGGLSVIVTTNPQLCTIYGQIDRNGSPVPGVAVSIILTRPDTLTIDSAFIDFNHTVYSNGAGTWQDDVYFLSGDTRNFYYTVSFTVAGQKRTLYCRPTTSGSHIINSILIDKP